MKILNIRFCNLNSLAGCWSIDLSSPEYQADGIFAITGTTGAGKTTILDAVCLALYAKTPRLGQMSKSVNEIMTKQTGECWAEVEFSTAKGQFRCHWSQHRARKSAQGSLQPPRHEIVDCKDDTPIETKMKLVSQKVVEVTGMNYDQFTRSILLAQGDFDAFLKAKPDDRSPILEQITGTKIYSRISKKVHEKRAEEQLRIDQLRIECNGFLPLEPEVVDEITNQLRELQPLVQETEKQIAHSRNLLDWYQQQDTLKEKIASQLKLTQELEKKWEELSPQREQHAMAETTKPLAPLYNRICEENELQKNETEELQSSVSKLGQLKEEINESLEKQTSLESAFNKLKERQLEQNETLNKVRKLDLQLNQLLKQKTELENELTNEVQKEKALKKDYTKTDYEIIKQQDRITSIQKYQQSCAPDRKLSEELSGIRQQMSRYVDLTNQLTLSAQETTKLIRQIDDCNREVDETSAMVAQIRNKLKNLQSSEEVEQKKLNATLEGKSLDHLFQLKSNVQDQLYLTDNASQLCTQQQSIRNTIIALTARYSEQQRHLKEILQQQKFSQHALNAQKELVDKQEKVTLLAAKIKNFEEERQNLQTGKPCPLCGSEEHPYQSSNTPQESEERTLLHREREKLQNIQEQFTSIQTQLAAEQTEAQHLNSKIHEQNELNHKTTEALTRLCEQLHIPSGDQLASVLANRSEKLHEQKNTLETKRQHAEKITAQLTALNLQKVQVVSSENNAVLKLQKISDLREKRTEQLKQSEGLRKNQEHELQLLTKTLKQLLAPFTELELQPDTHIDLLSQLKARMEKWQQSEEQLHQSATKLLRLQSEQEKIQVMLQQLEQRSDQLKKSFNQISTTFDSTHQNRYQLLGDMDPEQVEQKMRLELSTLEKQFEKQRTLSTSLLKQHAVYTEKAETLDKRIANRKLSQQQTTKDFQRKLSDSGFTDTEHFLTSMMDTEQFTALSLRIKELQDRLTETAAILKANREALEEQRNKELTTLPPGEIENVIQEQTIRLSELQQATGALNQKLQHNDKQQQLHEDKLRQINAQQTEVDRWSRLHELIGSNDGKKFRNFAQGLTFEIMVNHANTSLQKMTDRYLLVRDEHEPLELLVIDNYQAGELRSTKNLSGGESFIVSMALALGLSSMASNNVQVDSLFLDEGFGTLDEESLQTALDTLGSLHQEGKIIGIISHVRGLQDRISTRIQVSRGPGGLSTLSGPGISRVKKTI